MSDNGESGRLTLRDMEKTFGRIVSAPPVSPCGTQRAPHIINPICDGLKKSLCVYCGIAFDCPGCKRCL